MQDLGAAFADVLSPQDAFTLSWEGLSLFILQIQGEFLFNVCGFYEQLFK